MTPTPALLTDLRHHSHPYAFAHSPAAFGTSDRAALERLFTAEHDWQHRSVSGYECILRDATDEVAVELRLALVATMRAVTASPLTDDVQVTAQRMDPGQVIAEHSDRPLLGFEFARLIVYLTPDWCSEDGGILELLDGPDGAVTQVPPYYNHGVAFVLHADSIHRVTEVHRARRSVVFNFWHPANLPQVAEAVGALLADRHYSELPEAFGRLVAEAEGTLDEETSFRANLAALVLHRWGYEPEIAAAGYFDCAGLAGSFALSRVSHAVVKLASWIATLHQGVFDVAAWLVLVEELRGVRPPEALAGVWGLCLGGEVRAVAWEAADAS